MKMHRNDQMHDKLIFWDVYIPAQWEREHSVPSHPLIQSVTEPAS